VTVGLVKTLLKLLLVAAAVAAVAAVVSVKRSSSSTPVSYDAWPEVPAKPSA
jgi:hypothetical protein